MYAPQTASPTEYYFVYSRFSVSCQHVFEELRKYQTSIKLPLMWVCCDHPTVRSIVARYTDVVPSMLIFRGSQLIDRVDGAAIVSTLAPSSLSATTQPQPVQRVSPHARPEDLPIPSAQRAPPESKEPADTYGGESFSKSPSAVTSMAAQMRSEREQIEQEVSREHPHQRPL